MSDRELHLVLPARPENVIVIRQAAAGLGEALGLGPDRVGDLKAAVGEAANNAVLHAYEEGGPLELRAGSDGEELEISVGDQGHGFRPGPGVDEQQTLGLGLPLIAALSDSFTISGSSTGGTRTTMRFALHDAPQPSRNGSATPARADELAMGISPGSLARPVLARVIGALAARAEFSVDRLNDSVLLGDAVSAHAPADFSGGRLEVAITDGDGTLDVRVGPLVEGGGERILSEMNVPEGGSLRTLARSMEVTTGRVEGGDVAEYLVFAV